METFRTLVFFGILISAFIFSVSFATLYTQIHIEEGNVCSCKLPLPLLIPTFSSFGLLIGLISYYLLSPFVSKKCSQNLELFLNLLDPDEGEIIRMIIKNKGSISQAAVSKKFGKVKAFRLIERMKKRGVIEKEKMKKTNRIKLNEKFADILK